MKKILVPTDFSKNAQRALDYALSMTAGLEAEVHVLSVLSRPPSASGMLGSLMIRMKEDAQAKMKDLISRISTDNNRRIEPLIREGSTTGTICDIAMEVGADCIVMGTKGASDVDNVILGSIASKVISNAEVPVIAVPKGAVFEGLHKIIYASDFQKSGSEVVVKLLEFTEEYKSKIHVLHIYKSDVEPPLDDLRRIKAELSDYLETRTIKFHVHKNDDIREGIMDFMDAAEPDMLAMVTKKRSLIGKIFDPSITQRVAMSLDWPLISYRMV